MQIASALVLVLGLAACRSGSSASGGAAAPDGILVRVVDARTGAPVPGAEVRAGDAFVAAGSEDVLFAGEIGAVDRHGHPWRCDDAGEVRIAREALRRPIVARKGALWGCAPDPEANAKSRDAIRIELGPEEHIRVVCTTAEGRPGIGALVSIWTTAAGERPGSSAILWAARVERTDGSLDLPHAQHWRALAGEGADVRIAAYTLWGGEMSSEESTASFPRAEAADLRFTVAPSGSVDVTLVDEHGVPLAGDGAVDLRWLDAPPEPIEPGEDDLEGFEPDVDVPELPFAIRDGRRSIPGVILGHEFELVAAGLPGRVDPRATFRGPRAHGEHVRVELVARERSAVLTGRLVDAAGRPLALRSIDARIERAGQASQPEDDGSTSDADGRFRLEFAPLDAGSESVLVLEASAEPLGDASSVTERFVLGGGAGKLDPSPRARRALGPRLPGGEHDLGDVRCVPDGSR